MVPRTGECKDPASLSLITLAWLRFALGTCKGVALHDQVRRPPQFRTLSFLLFPVRVWLWVQS